MKKQIASCCILAVSLIMAGCQLNKGILLPSVSIPPAKLAQINDVEELKEKAEQAIQQQQWSDALAYYQRAKTLQPDDKTLQKAYQNTLNQRNIHITKLKNRLYLLQASVLSDEIKLLQGMAAADPNNPTVRAKLQQAMSKQGELHRFLVECAEAAIAVARPQRGKECLEMANKLPYKSADTEHLALINNTLDELAKTHKSTTVASNKKPSDDEENNLIPVTNNQTLNHSNDYKILALTKVKRIELFEKFNEAVQHQQFKEAQQLLKEIQESQPYYRTRKQHNQLKQAINVYVKKQTQKGIELYSTGNPEGALAIWQPLTELTPHNEELNNHISRAKRFISKLNQLQENENANSNPTKTQ
ncbi:hypothetical protein [Spartinivicinus poritis]|uniref:Tetratricopeptide repeat protein n=1 Tax=Spartinivicinus poritis TaxID=2994640 RepID=A0ABT5U9J1_9GAMM|nr:hypothetical protein [Spartinivicinus sp. A2-2]MDE1463040.1 hypothetical protein [Spartinivicinus sp. A2-2]